MADDHVDWWGAVYLSPAQVEAVSGKPAPCLIKIDGGKGKGVIGLAKGKRKDGGDCENPGRLRNKRLYPCCVEHEKIFKHGNAARSRFRGWCDDWKQELVLAVIQERKPDISFYISEGEKAAAMGLYHAEQQQRQQQQQPIGKGHGKNPAISRAMAIQIVDEIAAGDVSRIGQLRAFVENA